LSRRPNRQRHRSGKSTSPPPGATPSSRAHSELLVEHGGLAELLARAGDVLDSLVQGHPYEAAEVGELAAMIREKVPLRMTDGAAPTRAATG
jgi:hypothetical protein